MDTIWDPDNRAGVVLRTILDSRTLRIRRIAADREGNGFGVDYEMTPVADALPADRADPAAMRAWELRNAWRLQGRDDLGTEYDTTGWVEGPSPDGSKTEGVLDVYPIPPQEATWLDLIVHGPSHPDSEGHRQFTIRVTLPLPILTSEDIAADWGMTAAQVQAWREHVKAIEREIEDHGRISVDPPASVVERWWDHVEEGVAIDPLLRDRVTGPIVTVPDGDVLRLERLQEKRPDVAT